MMQFSGLLFKSKHKEPEQTKSELKFNTTVRVTDEKSFYFGHRGNICRNTASGLEVVFKTNNGYLVTGYFKEDQLIEVK